MKRLDQQLAELPSAPTAGPPSATLEALVRSAEPVSARNPRKQLAMLATVSVVVAGLAVLGLGIRSDISGLSTAYMAAMGLAWLVALLIAGGVALVPAPHSALPRGRIIGVVASLLCAAFVSVGLLWTDSAPSLSHQYEASVATVVHWAPYCLSVGTGASVIVLITGAVLLFRAIPVGSPWVGAGIGAAGGCLGGLILHLHCDIAEPTHFGLVHGGVVVIAATLGALVLPRATELR